MGIGMYHIILSLQDFFDMYWLIENVIDDTNKKIIEQEMSQEYGITKEMVKNRKPLCVRKPSEDVECDDDDNDELDDFDDNCIIGWDNGMQTYFFYNGHEDLFIGGIDGKIYKSVFAVLYKLIKLGYSFKFRNENIIDNLLDKMESR
jgi:hypothetical protein